MSLKSKTPFKELVIVKPHSLAVLVKYEKFEEISKELSLRLDCKLCFDSNEKYENFLLYEDTGLHWSHVNYKKAFFIDFLKQAKNLKPDQGQNLLKAIGSKKNLRVLDLTLGWGKDSLLLCLSGLHVRGVERFYPVYLLVEDALKRAQNSKVLNEKFRNFEIVAKDSFDVLKNLKQQPDVIYLDPMFFDSKKSLAKKNIEVLKEFYSDQDESQAKKLLEACLSFKSKIVVKRSLKQKALLEGVLSSHPGHSVRYDTYHNK